MNTLISFIKPDNSYYILVVTGCHDSGIEQARIRKDMENTVMQEHLVNVKRVSDIDFFIPLNGRVFVVDYHQPAAYLSTRFDHLFRNDSCPEVQFLCNYIMSCLI
ncbi:hypothetical protein [Dipodfec virus UOA04_Rod_391]|nr:hypothetical protein [Dipodfec virus UOA04_Rod_391]